MPHAMWVTHLFNLLTSAFLFPRLVVVLQALMSRIKRDNAAVEQMTAEAKALQAKVKQLEARQPAGGGTAAGPAADDPARR